MSHPHEIVKCKVCKDVIRQCRCASRDKITTWEVCNKCKQEDFVNSNDLSDPQ